jgi:hypothetical protein
MVSPDMLNWETATLFAQHYRGRNTISPDMLNWETALLFAQLYRGRRSISPDMLNWEMTLHYVGTYLQELAAAVVDHMRRLFATSGPLWTKR